MRNDTHIAQTYQKWFAWSTTRVGLFTILAAGLLAGVMAVVIVLGKSMVLVLVLSGFALLAWTFRQPLPAIFLLMLLSTNCLGFVDLASLPYVPLGPAGRLNPPDIMCVLLAGIALLRLKQRGEKPLFFIPLLMLAAAVAISFIWGLALGSTDVKSAVNGLRPLSGYLLYIGLAGTVNTPRRLRSVVWIVFAFAVISVCIQLVEAVRGSSLGNVASPEDDLTIVVEGHVVPYLWNRCTVYLAVALFLAMGYAIRTRSVPHAAIAALSLLGFGIALVRQWYIYVAVGVVVMIVVSRKGRLKTILGLTLISLLLVASVNFLGSGILSAAFPFADLWLARVTTLLHVQEISTVAIRTDVYRRALGLFSSSPLFGYGPGSMSKFAEGPEGVLADIGMPNTLLYFGFFGWLAIILTIGAVFRAAYRMVRESPSIQSQGLAAGLVGVWVCFVFGYASGFDFFTSSTFGVGLAMGLVDRLRAFSPVREDPVPNFP